MVRILIFNCIEKIRLKWENLFQLELCIFVFQNTCKDFSFLKKIQQFFDKKKSVYVHITKDKEQKWE
jgi:hypothetical protein